MNSRRPKFSKNPGITVGMLLWLKKVTNKFHWTYLRYKPRPIMSFNPRFGELPAFKKSVDGNAETPLLTFFALGDFGESTLATRSTASAMNVWACAFGQPDFILGLGDNFYPSGVTSSGDKQFQTTWRDVFLCYESLRVPWHMILGNHDYMRYPMGQVEHTTNKKHNPDGLWSMPAQSYQLRHEVNCSDIGKVTKIDLFAIDTNGVQGHVFRTFPDLPNLLDGYIEQLGHRLEASDADWKIVFGHHPMYTQGKGHGAVAKSLRLSRKELRNRNKSHGVKSSPGEKTSNGIGRELVDDGNEEEGDDSYGAGDHRTASTAGPRRRFHGLEDVVADGAAHVYFSGHEHVFQHHVTRGLHHFVCGASGAEIRKGDGLYGGWDDQHAMDWVSSAAEVGFVACQVFQERMVVQFVNTAGTVLKEVVVDRVRPDVPA